MDWKFWIDNAAPLQAIAGLVQATMALVGVAGIFLLWSQQRESKKNRREKFFQSLISIIHGHNWKFIEHWDNAGVRPGMVEAISLEDNKVEFGRRVVVLSHMNILWQAFLHRDHLNSDDIDGFKNWAASWLKESRAQLEIVLNQGDLYPLDFLYWLRDTIFVGEFSAFMGPGLKGRFNRAANNK